MTLPRLSRPLSHPNVEEDKELWQPRWNCFCCRDTGMVSLNLVRQIIPDYQDGTDLRVACQHPKCRAGLDFASSPNFDQRFTSSIAIELDKMERENWDATIKAKQQQVLDTKELATTMSLRKRDRTTQEEELAQAKHDEVVNREPDQLRHEAIAYLGAEYMQHGAA